MNTPNPLMPQGSLQQSKGKSNVRVAFFTIAAIHVVLLCGLLIQGCKPNDPAPPVEDPSTNAVFDPLPGSDLGATSAAPIDPNAGLPVDPTAGLPVDPTISQPTTAVAPTGAVVAVPPTVAPPVDPVPPVSAEPAPAVETKVHVVQKGEMLATIAKKYGVSLRAIEEANPNVDPLKLQIGQKLEIPAPAAAPATAATETTTTGGAETVYTVKSGDALEKIARQHNTTVKAIKAANNLRTDRINVGQKLKIPAPAGTTNP
jgi:LysM repeat protein